MEREEEGEWADPGGWAGRGSLSKVGCETRRVSGGVVGWFVLMGMGDDIEVQGARWVWVLGDGAVGGRWTVDGDERSGVVPKDDDASLQRVSPSCWGDETSRRCWGWTDTANANALTLSYEKRSEEADQTGWDDAQFAAGGEEWGRWVVPANQKRPEGRMGRVLSSASHRSQRRLVSTRAKHRSPLLRAYKGEAETRREREMGTGIDPLWEGSRLGWG